MRWWRSSALPAACCASPSICLGLRPMARQRSRRPAARGARDTDRPGGGQWETGRNGGRALSPPAQSVTVEDCEKVTRQLQFALEVDGVQYQRLEVASPGIDRPLRGEQDL